MQDREPTGICCMAQETPAELCINLEGRDMGGRFKREGIYVYIRLIPEELMLLNCGVGEDS